MIAAPQRLGRTAMKSLALAALTAAAVFAPALALAGDPAAGEKAFRNCRACHMVVSDGGDVIVKGGKQGPNLWGVIGRTAGSVEGFKYGASLAAAGEAGLVWDEASLVEYSTDPKKFLAAYLDDPKARSKMAYKLRKGGEDIAAFLAQHGAGS